MLFVGRRGTGKSKLCEDIMFRIHKNVDFGMAMSPTEETTSMFRQHMPDSWVYSGFSSAKLESMLSMQRELIRNGKERSLFLICDDCTYDKKIFHGTGIRDLFMNGRHCRITYMNCLQYVMDMGPDLRTQVDYVFALKESIIS